MPQQASKHLTTTYRVVIVNNNRRWLRGAKNSFSYIRKTYVKRISPNSKPIKSNAINLNLPGAQYILGSKTHLVFKLFWLMVLLCSTISCFFQITDRFWLFLSNPTSSRTTLTRSNTVKFPSVTVCRPIDSPVYLYPQLFKLSKNYSRCTTLPAHLVPQLNISTIWTLMNIEKDILRYEIDSTSHNKGLKRGGSHESMKSRLKVNTTLIYHGNCTTFSINESIPFRGEGYTVKIMFDLSTKIPSGCRRPNVLSYMFHLDHEDITYNLMPFGNILERNNPLIFGISSRRFNILNRTEAPCDSVSVINQCQRKCFEDYLKSKIPCRLPFMQLNNLFLCTKNTTSKNAFSTALDEARWFPYSERCACPVPCEEILYSYDLKHSRVANDTVLAYYFEDNVMFDTEEYYSYNIIPFLCDVGGNLGLYLGLSIPAIIELLQSVAIYCFHKFVS